MDIWKIIEWGEDATGLINILMLVGFTITTIKIIVYVVKFVFLGMRKLAASIVLKVKEKLSKGIGFILEREFIGVSIRLTCQVGGQGGHNKGG